MEDKYFCPSETYKDAIVKDDKNALKALLIGIIGSDPTFATTEFDEAYRYIAEKYIEQVGDKPRLTEKYVLQEDEYIAKDESEWTEEYFGLKLVWLRDNFAIDKRLEDIKKVGNVVYKEKKTLGKVKQGQYKEAKRDEIKKNQAVPTITSGYNSKWLWFAVTIIAIGLIAIFIVMMYSNIDISAIGKLDILNGIKTR